MLKRSLTLLISVFLFHISYSQLDSIPPRQADTLSLTKDSLSAIPPGYPEPKEKKSNQPLYEINRRVDLPIAIAGTAFSLYAFTIIYDKPVSSVEQINALDTDNIPSFDRWAIYPYSDSLSRVAAYEFYGSMPLPLFAFLLSEGTRRDYGKLTFLYWQVMSITGLFGAGAPLFIDRYRPYAYSNETPMDKRRGGIAKNSAFSGHVEIVAASVFFTAKVFNDYYPETKWLMFSLASAATASMGYWRLKGGEHFPSDVLIGAAIGTLSGILVPHYHKHRTNKGNDMSVLPFMNDKAKGVSLVYKVK